MDKYHRFSTPEEVQTWVKQYYTYEELKELEDYEKIKDNKIPALLFYKGNGHEHMNHCVRNGITDTNDIVDVNSLQRLLLSKSIKESIEVYRFINIKELKILLRNTSGKRAFEYPSFLSTTLLWEYYSMKKGKFLISIRIPEGTAGTYLPEINYDRPEYEILLPHHLKLRRINWTTFEIIQ